MKKTTAFLTEVPVVCAKSTKEDAEDASSNGGTRGGWDSIIKVADELADWLRCWLGLVSLI